ncbi:unnamed protein product, partial [Rotaria sp. Silwood2]
MGEYVACEQTNIRPISCLLFLRGIFSSSAGAEGIYRDWDQKNKLFFNLLLLDEDGYRVRIGNFPHSATREQIFKRLTINFPKIRENLILCNESNPNEPIIAYVIDQMSEINVKKMIHAWHNQLFSSDEPNRMKCQWEVNVEYFNLTIGFTMPIIQTQSRAPSIISSINSIADHKRNARRNLQKEFSARKTRNDIDHYLSSQSNSNFERVSIVNIIELPSTWDFNNAVLLTERTDEI